jgi:hypothetical protein
MYLRGGVVKDENKARQLFEMATANGNAKLKEHFRKIKLH